MKGRLAQIPVWGWLTVILLCALALRVHGLTSTPAPLANWDEQAWAWAGQSLIASGHPVSWSELPAYQVTPTTFWGTEFPIVHDWMDHPPLFSLLVGGEAHLFGQHTMGSVDLGTIRLVPVALSLVTIVLAFALSRELFGIAVAYVVAVALAVSPFVVDASRLVESEALLTPMWLGALLIVARIHKGKASRREVVALCFLAALAPLVKMPGVVVALSSGLLLLGFGHRRLFVALALSGLAGVAAFVGYGFIVDWHQFQLAFMAQMDRRHGGNAAIPFFLSKEAGLGGLVPLNDPAWLTGCGLALLAPLVLREERFALATLAIAVVTYGLTMGLMADAEYAARWHGWFRIPLVPIAYMACAVYAAPSVTYLEGRRRAAGAGRRPAWSRRPA